MSFDENFLERIKIGQVCEFLKVGVEQGKGEGEETKTFMERHNTHFMGMIKSLKKFREKVLDTEWDELSESEREMKIEDFYFPVLRNSEAISDLYFEVGLLVGFNLYPQFQLTPEKIWPAKKKKNNY